MVLTTAIWPSFAIFLMSTMIFFSWRLFHKEIGVSGILERMEEGEEGGSDGRREARACVTQRCAPRAHMQVACGVAHVHRPTMTTCCCSLLFSRSISLTDRSMLRLYSCRAGLSVSAHARTKVATFVAIHHPLYLGTRRRACGRQASSVAAGGWRRREAAAGSGRAGRNEGARTAPPSSAPPASSACHQREMTSWRPWSAHPGPAAWPTHFRWFVVRTTGGARARSNARSNARGSGQGCAWARSRG